MLRALGKTLQYIMSDLQLESVIAAALPELELISDVTSCIKQAKEITSSALQPERILEPRDNSTNLQ